MGKGNGNNRIREMDKSDGKKESSVKLKGLSWDSKAAQPAFLRNALAALQGPKASTSSATTVGEIGSDGRPSIPTRPGRDEGQDEDESEEDEWDMARGDEAPAVVVLKEGRHLDRDEVDRIRAEAKAGSAPDPLASSSAPTKTKNSGSLTFSSNDGTTTGGKRKVSELDTEESWEEVIKRSKKATEDRATEIKLKKEEEMKAKEKLEKKRKKEKKEQQKKVAKLSFADD